MTLRFFILNDLCLLSAPESVEPVYGFAFRVVAEDRDGNRFEHFYRGKNRTDNVPMRLWKLLSRVKKAKFTSFSQFSRRYWRETYPNTNSKAGREMLADVTRIECAEEERDAERESERGMIMHEAEFGLGSVV